MIIYPDQEDVSEVNQTTRVTALSEKIISQEFVLSSNASDLLLALFSIILSMGVNAEEDNAIENTVRAFEISSRQYIKIKKQRKANQNRQVSENQV